MVLRWENDLDHVIQFRGVSFILERRADVLDFSMRGGFNLFSRVVENG